MNSRILIILITLFTSIAQAEKYTYDALGRLKTVKDDNKVTVTYEYDAVGNRKVLSTTSVPLLNKPKITMTWSAPVTSTFGHSATLTWSTENAIQCTGAIMPLNKLLFGTTGKRVITTGVSATAELKCTNTEGDTWASAFMFINGACPPNTICLPPGDSEF